MKLTRKRMRKHFPFRLGEEAAAKAYLEGMARQGWILTGCDVFLYI